MKKNLKIGFVDFFDDGVYQIPLITKLLSRHYNIEIDNDSPQILFYSVFGCQHLNYDCHKFLFAGENRKWKSSITSYKDFDPKVFDISLSPLEVYNEFGIQASYMIEMQYFEAFINGDLPKMFEELRNKEKKHFCNFIYGNKRGLAKYRADFCQKLMDKYKFVHCLGRVLRNCDMVMPKPKDTFYDWETEKYHLLSDFKFTIAFENSNARGYVGEKIFQPFLVGSVPIYWGAPDILDYFSKDAFIWAEDFDNFDDLIEYVKKVDNDDELYKKYQCANPLFKGSKIYNYAQEKIAKQMFDKIELALQNPPKTSLNKLYIKLKKLYYYGYKRPLRNLERKITGKKLIK